MNIDTNNRYPETHRPIKMYQEPFFLYNTSTIKTTHDILKRIETIEKSQNMILDLIEKLNNKLENIDKEDDVVTTANEYESEPNEEADEYESESESESESEFNEADEADEADNKCRCVVM